MWQPNKLTRTQVPPVGLAFRKSTEHAQHARCESRRVLPLRRNLEQVSRPIDRVLRARMLPLIRFQKTLSSLKQVRIDQGRCAIHEMESFCAKADRESGAFDSWRAMGEGRQCAPPRTELPLPLARDSQNRLPVPARRM